MEEESASQLARDLRQSVGAFVRAIRQHTDTVKSAQTEALELLLRLGPMNVATLAEKRGVTHQTMRVVVGHLTATGLAQQTADPVDRRARVVTISPTGRDTLAYEQRARASQIELAINLRLSADEQKQLRVAIPLLDRLANPLK